MAFMVCKDISFVCCIESGSLEDPTIRLIRSLRQFGGSLANSQIIAVTPRFGLPLNVKTRSALDLLNVEYLDRRWSNHKYSWFKFFNKPLSLIYAREKIKSPVTCFLDSDLLVFGEPSALRLNDHEDIVACPSDIKEMGSTGPGDIYEPIWRANLELNGISPDTFPWTITCYDNIRIRLYWNSGVFAYRSSSKFADEYLNTTIKALENSTISKSPTYSLGFNEMAALGISAVKLNLKWRELPFTYNFSCGTRYPLDNCNHDVALHAKIFHYHDALWPEHWTRFIHQLDPIRPTEAAWLKKLGPLQNPSSTPIKIINKILQTIRKMQEKKYMLNCIKV